MNMLANLKTDDAIEDEKDVLGGSRTRESGLYPMTVSMAYLSQSAGGATSLNLTLKDDAGEIRQTLWMTSGKAKGGLNYYTDKNGEKKYLPGFVHANSLCLLAVGKEISALDTEDKVLNIYSPEAKKEMPTKVPVLMDLLNQEILVGLIKQVVDKSAKDAAGNYQPTGETREENEIDKLFRARDRMTTAEIRAQAGEAAFADSWETKWKGQTKNKASGVAATGKVGAPGASAPAANTGRAATSLFG